MLNTELRPYNQLFQQSVQRGFLNDLRMRERSKMDEYIRAREYYDGIHNTQLTDRLREFLTLQSPDSEFTANYCPMVVQALTDRLKVTGFASDEGRDAEQQTELMWRWWRHNRMDRKQNIVHHAAVRDGDTFVLVEWDDEANIPRFYHEPAYAGDGVMVYYSEERRDEIEFASKAWRITHGSRAGKRRRLNLYFADRIEKYVSDDSISSGQYRPYEDDNDPAQVIIEGKLGMAAVNWWTDTGTETGKPLGVPVVHFKNYDTGDQYGRSRLTNVIPLQDALNKTLIDLLATLDTEAFGLLVGTGTDAWSNVKVGPGAIAAVSKPSNEADLKRLPGTNPQGMIAAYHALVMEIARITGTPLSYFQQSSQVAAEGTLKQQEVTLLAQAEKAQTDFGDGWEQCMNIGRRLHNAFSDDEELDEMILIDTVWEQAELRNEKAQAEMLAIKVEKLGISQEQAQVEMGYTQQQIASFARAKMREQAMSIREIITRPALPAPRTPDSEQPTDEEAQARNLSATEMEADEAA